MALTITATITVNDDEAYTAREAAILSAFQAHPAGTAAPAQVITTAVVNPAGKSYGDLPEPAAAPAAAKAPAKRAPKAAPAPEAEASTTPAVLDTTLDEPADEPEAAADEALIGTVVETKEYTLDDAVTAATNLINEGKVADVKAALAKAGGAKRVSELKGDNITAFMTALGN